MSTRNTDTRDKPSSTTARDPKTGEFKPTEEERKKRRTASDEPERTTPPEGKLGRAHD